jgi:hypothetical protein
MGASLAEDQGKGRLQDQDCGLSGHGNGAPPPGLLGADRAAGRKFGEPMTPTSPVRSTRPCGGHIDLVRAIDRVGTGVTGRLHNRVSRRVFASTWDRVDRRVFVRVFVRAVRPVYARANA